MEKINLNVIYSQKAEKSIYRIYVFIAEKGYIETAVKFTHQLYDFGDSLSLFSKKYPVCKKKPLAQRKIRCAILKKNYIFLYKVIKNELIILNIIHSSRYVY